MINSTLAASKITRSSCVLLRGVVINFLNAITWVVQGCFRCCGLDKLIVVENLCLSYIGLRLSVCELLGVDYPEFNLYHQHVNDLSNPPYPMTWRDRVFPIVEIALIVTYSCAFLRVSAHVKDEVDLLKTSFMLAFSLDYDQRMNTSLFSRWIRRQDYTNIYNHYLRFDNCMDEISNTRFWCSIVIAVIYTVILLRVDLHRDCPVACCPTVIPTEKPSSAMFL